MERHDASARNLPAMPRPRPPIREWADLTTMQHGYSSANPFVEERIRGDKSEMESARIRAIARIVKGG